jgi:hypothetical protein
MANLNTVHDSDFPNFDPPLPESRSVAHPTTYEETGSFVIRAVQSPSVESIKRETTSFLQNAVARLQEIGYMDPVTGSQLNNLGTDVSGHNYFSALYGISPPQGSPSSNREGEQLLSLFAGCTAHQGREVVSAEARTSSQAPSLTEVKRADSTLSMLADESIEHFIELHGGYDQEIEAKIMTFMNQKSRHEKTVYATKKILLELAISSGMDADIARRKIRGSRQRSINLKNAVLYTLPKLRRRHYTNQSSDTQLKVIRSGTQANYGGLPALFS